MIIVFMKPATMFSSPTVINIQEGVKPDHIAIDSVTKIIASGSELKRILSWGYPDHESDYQVYVGDFARQIVANYLMGFFYV